MKLYTKFFKDCSCSRLYHFFEVFKKVNFQSLLLSLFTTLSEEHTENENI